MKIEDFRTRHKADAEHLLTITWDGDGCNGSYETWITKEFTFQLDEIQQELVDGWVNRNATEANSWVWKLTNPF